MWSLISYLDRAKVPLSVVLLLLFSLSAVSDSETPWTVACQASLSFTISQSVLNSCPLSQWCHPTILSSVIPFSSCLVFSSIKAFSSKSILGIRWPKYWSFIFSISPSNEYSGLISFRIDLLDLLAVQGTLKSLLQHHISKASILRCSAFFIVQLSHPYITIGKKAEWWRIDTFELWCWKRLLRFP